MRASGRSVGTLERTLPTARLLSPRGLRTAARASQALRRQRSRSTTSYQMVMIVDDLAAAQLVPCDRLLRQRSVAGQQLSSWQSPAGAGGRLDGADELPTGGPRKAKCAFSKVRFKSCLLNPFLETDPNDQTGFNVRRYDVPGTRP